MYTRSYGRTFKGFYRPICLQGLTENQTGLGKYEVPMSKNVHKNTGSQYLIVKDHQYLLTIIVEVFYQNEAHVEFFRK